jgi:hypothetical protein
MEGETMIYLVARASSIFGEEKPCEGAFLKNGEWKVEISDLPSLMKFISVNGKIVMYGPGEGGSLLERPRITIYDDYLE